MIAENNISIRGSSIICDFITTISSKEDLNPKTIKEYTGDLKQFVKWFENQETKEEDIVFNIENVATPTLTRYRDSMQNISNLKPSTINRRIISIKRFFDWAMESNLIKRNPSKPVKLIPVEKTSPRQLTDKEESNLVAAVEQNGSIRDQTIIVLMLHTGLRLMEICNLTKKDISIRKRSGTLIVRSGKRGKHREVPINSTCRDVLEKYLSTVSTETYLFSSEKTKGRLSERALRFIINKYIKLSKLEGLSAHSLRHRFGYVMVAKTPIHRLAQIMGHDSLNTTMIYIKATREDLQKEVEKIAWK